MGKRDEAFRDKREALTDCMADLYACAGLEMLSPDAIGMAMFACAFTQVALEEVDLEVLTEIVGKADKRGDQLARAMTLALDGVTS